MNHGICECGDAECRRPGKHPRTKHGLNDATATRAQIKKWWAEFPNSNIGIVTGAESNLLVFDVDGSRGKRAWKKLLDECDCAGIDVLTAITGRGQHCYFTCNQPIRSSAGKLGAGLDVRAEGGYVVGVGSNHVNGHRYAWKDSHKQVGPLPERLLGYLLSVEKVAERAMPRGIENNIPRGQRNTTLTRFAGVMRRPGMSRRAIEAALLAENRYRCSPPLLSAEVEGIAASVARYTPTLPFSDWPAPMGDAAYHGLAGEMVAALARHSEADPVGLLSHAIVFTGSAAGNSTHIRVAADRHGVNIFLVTVGDTGKARKGLAFNQTKQLFHLADPEWTKNCIATGLSSGEGLIHAISERTGFAGDGSVPRLLIFEPEFGSVLRVMLRQGNTLSPILRQAWDSTTLGVLTRKDPLKAEASHISFIGHITQPELKDLLSNRDIYGGLANRILWPCVRRHGINAELGGTSDDLLKPIASKVGLAIAQAKKRGELTLSADAKEKWRELYTALSVSEGGRFEAIVSRPEAQVIRLAAVYSLLDRAERVGVKHLEAAMALWQYCHASAAAIFGSKHGSSLEDQLLKLLVTSRHGLTRTEISAAFNNHKSKDAILAALNKLQESGQVEMASVKTHGRSAEKWYLTKREHQP